MPLSSGDRLGPYEIIAPIGAGGMGEVYRARDSKLNRDVAIKILPAALAHDAQYMARFEREAQTLASLNHPNIATVYGMPMIGLPTATPLFAARGSGFPCSHRRAVRSSSSCPRIPTSRPVFASHQMENMWSTESDESGTFEVYVAAFPSFAVKRKLSIGGGLYPAWSRDGMEIFYRAIGGTMMDVEVHLGATIEASVAKPLFKFGTGNRGNQFAVSGDGKRFLIADSVRQGDVDRPEITLVLNWAADIR
jgi:hypothetical protein